MRYETSLLPNHLGYFLSALPHEGELLLALSFIDLSWRREIKGMSIFVADFHGLYYVLNHAPLLQARVHVCERSFELLVQ